MSDNGDDPVMLSLDKGETVYNYALYIPPIIRKKHGHLQTWDMCLAIILLGLNVAMQVGMTFIVGQGVIFEGNAWRFTLVGMDAEDQYKEGQLSKDLDQMNFLERETSFGKFFEQPDPMGHLLHNDQDDDKDAVSKQNDDTIAKLEKRLSRDQADVATIESVSPMQQRKKATSFTQLSSETHHEWKFGWQSPTGDDLPDDQVVELIGNLPAKPNASPFAAGRKTLCTMKNATYNCLPPSVRYADRWEYLDTNGDGVWSLEEAEKDEHNFEKKFGAKAFLVFRAITVGLTDRVVVDPKLWVSQEVKDMKALPKAYFDYWMGDAALCSYADPKVCGTLLKRGYFAEAMNPKNPGKAIDDIDGALDYCVWMLTVGGGCDQSLPQIYKLYRSMRNVQCGDSGLSKDGLWRNPHSDVDKVYITAVDYDSLGKHLKAETTEYLIFLFLVLQLWLLALLSEMRELVKLAEFTKVFPGCKGTGDDMGVEEEKNEDGDVTYTITGITSGHRSGVIAMVVMRTGVVVYIGVVGCIFLVMETGYMDLLMNAVALAFILEIDEILFGSVARQGTYDELEACNDLEFETKLPTKGCCGWMLEKDFWGIIMFPILSIILMVSYQIFTTKPIIDVLNCACYQIGGQCHDAQLYNKQWWDAYWTTTLPHALAEIAKLKAAAGF